MTVGDDRAVRRRMWRGGGRRGRARVTPDASQPGAMPPPGIAERPFGLPPLRSGARPAAVSLVKEWFR